MDPSVRHTSRPAGQEATQHSSSSCRPEVVPTPNRYNCEIGLIGWQEIAIVFFPKIGIRGALQPRPIVRTGPYTEAREIATIGRVGQVSAELARLFRLLILLPDQV
jgi:hypothetical protein